MAGAVSAWRRDVLVFENARYVALGPGGQRWASERFDPAAGSIEVTGDGFELHWRAPFRAADRPR